MTYINKFVFFIFSLLVLTFFSCSARINGAVMEGGAAELSVRMSIEPRALVLIRSLSSFMGQDLNAPVLDGEAISRSMSAAPGIRSVSLVNTSPSALEGVISISHVGDFLVAGDAAFITYAEKAGVSSILIALDRNSAPEVISRLSPEAEEYLSALMAPAVLGESMSRQEYLDLISMVYGRPLANEIASSRVRASLEFPRPLLSVSGGTYSGNRAEFDIPLLDILVLEQPMRFALSW